MLQKANFPTFMGNSLVIDTINVTGPLAEALVASHSPAVLSRASTAPAQSPN